MTTLHLSCIALLFTFAATVAAQTPLNVARECVYALYVKTGDRPKAGTDSKITVTLADRYAESFKINDLQKWGLMSSSHDYFEMGNLDIFSGRAKCLDTPICKLKLASDAKGASPGWFVEYIEVTITMPHEKCSQSKFKIDKWLGHDEPPYELSVTLEECMRYVA